MMRHRNRGCGKARRGGAILLSGLLALSVLVYAAAAVAMAPPAPPAPVTAAGTIAPPPPPVGQASAACDLAAASTEAEAAFLQLLTTSPPLEWVRVMSTQRFLPVGAGTEMHVVKKYNEALRYRVFVTNTRVPMRARAIDDRWVWSERAPPETKGIDAGGLDDKSEKTVVHFTPPAFGQKYYWRKRQVYFLACGAGNVPLHASQLVTYFTTKTTCRVLAIGMCVFFYVLAALMSWRIHGASQKFKGEGAARGLKGTNYASAWQHLDPVVMTADQNGRGSASRLQVLFFSLLVFGVVAYIWMVTGNLSDMSVTVLSLMGISGLGATAAAATEMSRKRLSFENWAWLVDRKWLPKGGAAEVNLARWKDLFMTNNEFEVSRFQMITFSVLVGAALLSAGGETADLSDFTIPDAFLGILGLSQLVYVAGKLVDGPSIGQLNAQIDTLRSAEVALRHVLIAADSDTSPPGRNVRLTRQDLPAEAGKTYDAYLETWERTRTMFESTLSEKVSAVAQGVRPPFAYLSLPPDAMAALERQYAEISNQLLTRAAGSGAPADQAAIDDVKNARDTYTVAREQAQCALGAFIEAKQKHDDAVPAPPREMEQRYENMAEREAQIRTALEGMRRAVARLALLAQS